MRDDFIDHAFTSTHERIVATSIGEEAWEHLKASYTVGDFTMPCCNSPAIPKTSTNGLHFFAHQFGECTSAPESKWHVEAKHLVASCVRGLGICCEIEMDGRPIGFHWIADTFFVYGQRRIVLELQHSYQTLLQYRERQRHYRECGIERYWLLYGPQYNTLTKSMAKWRLKNEFGGKFPKNCLFPCVSDVPVGLLETEPALMVQGAGLHISLSDWLTGVLEQRLKWSDGKWTVSDY